MLFIFPTQPLTAVLLYLQSSDSPSMAQLYSTQLENSPSPSQIGHSSLSALDPLKRDLSPPPAHSGTNTTTNRSGKTGLQPQSASRNENKTGKNETNLETIQLLFLWLFPLSTLHFSRSLICCCCLVSLRWVSAPKSGRKWLCREKHQRPVGTLSESCCLWRTHVGLVSCGRHLSQQILDTATCLSTWGHACKLGAQFSPHK